MNGKCPSKHEHSRLINEILEMILQFFRTKDEFSDNYVCRNKEPNRQLSTTSFGWELLPLLSFYTVLNQTYWRGLDYKTDFLNFCVHDSFFCSSQSVHWNLFLSKDFLGLKNYCIFTIFSSDFETCPELKVSMFSISILMKIHINNILLFSF